MIETNDFKIVINNIVSEIQQTQLKRFQDANTNVLELYFHIGKIIDERISWGNKFVDDFVIKDNQRINLLEASFSKLEEKKKVNEIYFNGQIYDAYSKLLDIMIEAKKELIAIDRYADKITLDMISRLKIKVTLIIKQNGLLKKLDKKKLSRTIS